MLVCPYDNEDMNNLRLAPRSIGVPPLRSQNRPRIERGNRDGARVRGAPRCVGAPPVLPEETLKHRVDGHKIVGDTKGFWGSFDGLPSFLRNVETFGD